MDRNSAIFWVFYMSGTLIGNIYVFVAWKGKTTVSQSEETSISIILATLVGAGVILLLFLKKVPDPGEDSNQKVSLLSDSWQYIKSSVAMAKERHVQLMLPVMFYSGFEMGFWQTIYPTCVGATKLLGADADRLVGLASIFICVGELLPGFLLFIPSISRYRGYSYCLSMVGFFVACVICVLMLPPESVMHDTYNMAIIPPNEAALMVAAFLLGYADGILNTNLIALIGNDNTLEHKIEHYHVNHRIY